MAIWNYDDTEWMVVMTTLWSFSCASIPTIIQFWWLATVLHLWPAAVPCKYMPFATFPANIPRMPMGKLAGKVASLWGKSLPFAHPPLTRPCSCLTGHSCTLPNPHHSSFASSRIPMRPPWALLYLPCTHGLPVYNMAEWINRFLTQLYITVVHWTEVEILNHNFKIVPETKW